MALRVLLADESPTIKKAIQLALQDFAVDVRSVNIGVDVLNIAKAFNPDIIFSDVLLQKMNGYEVAAQLKADPETQNIPTVLMWSGFLSLDEGKYQVSRADAKIEKPFDVSSLRELVKSLVPRTQEQKLADYLHFPNMPEIQPETTSPDVEFGEVTPAPQTIGLEPHYIQEVSEPDLDSQNLNPIHLGPPTDVGPNPFNEPGAPEQTASKEPWDMNNFESIEEFAHTDADDFEAKPITTTQNKPFFDDDSDDESPWVQQEISQLKIDPENFAGTSSHYQAVTANASEGLDPNPEIEHTQADLQVEAVPPAETFVGRNELQDYQVMRPSNNPSKDQIEEYIEKVIGKTLEQTIREMLPRIAKEIIEEEIHKLTQQEE